MTTEVEWRRQWHPDLRSQPWKPMVINGEPFLTKTHFTEDSYQFLISDQVSLWHESLDKEAVSKRTKRLNPSVEAPASKILDVIRSSLEDGKSSVTLSVAFKNLADTDDQKILLSLSTKLAGLPFVWKFNGDPAERNMVSDHLILPLLTMVGELSRRQEELFKMLRNKDKEIDDLKAQGVKVTRKHLETGNFDDTAFRHSMSVSKGFLEVVQKQGMLAFDGEGQVLYRDAMTKQAYLNRSDADGSIAEGETFASLGGTPETRSDGATGQSWTNRLPPSLAGSVSPSKSPTKSPVKSPRKAGSGEESSPMKDTELLRRQALERRLQEEEEKKQQKKKKKKIKF